MRSAAQTVSYEIAMGFSLVGVLILAGTMNLREIVLAQQGGIFDWYWLPLLPLFVIYMISGLAETNRAPFDQLRKASQKSSLGSTWNIPVRHLQFSFLAEYANMILISGLTAILFAGGWLITVPGCSTTG